MEVINWMESVVVVQLVALWTWLWAFWETKFIICHCLANFVVALAVSVYIKEFVLEKTLEVLWRKVLPLVAVFAVFATFATTLRYDGLTLAIWGLIELKLLADLLDNLGKLGIPWVKNIAPTTLRSNGAVIPWAVEEIESPQRE